MIEIIDVHKNLNGVEILKGVNLRVEKGDTLALIGGSGKGKSVLLKNIIGLMSPDCGQILIDQQDISKLKGRKLKALKDRIGIVFQFGALFDSLSVYENVAFPLREKTNLNAKQLHNKVIEELTSVGLGDDVEKFPDQLSGGMRKRVALARCLALDPEIIFFDEPTTGLDPVVSNSVYKMIRDLQDERHLTAVIVSHDIPEIFDIADHVAMIYDGKIIESSTSKEFQNSSNKIVQAFLKGEVA